MLDAKVSRADELGWPAVKRAETRPWTWWWWHGCAVSKEDITANREALQKSGIGGVTIVCLLDVKDDQAKKLAYLSTEWRDAVVHAVHEARRLGMDADMSPVPGWAFGGPWVPRGESCANVEVKHWNTAATEIRVGDLVQLVPDPAGGKVKTLKVQCTLNSISQEFSGQDGGTVELPAKPEQVVVERASYGIFPEGPTVDVTAIVQKLVGDQRRRNVIPLSAGDLKDLDALVVVSADGKAVDLTKKTHETGATNLVVKAFEGRYYAVLTRRGSSGVRMPTPDCRGPVVDHLSATAVRNYLGRFDQAFKGLKDRDLPRAYNNDSWEIHLNWTPGLLGEFAKRRGYDLRQHLPAFIGQGTEDEVARVACDYRHTVSDMMVDEFTATFSKWASSHGGRITGEVQDEPGNELDINALYDIPQADLGGPRDWFIKNGNYATDHFIRRCKIPASAAHILGKPLVSSETLTCMGPILDTPLEDVKEKIDYDLVAGVNHTMFHGITYSPAHARWPGWLFYAGTHLGPFNPMWRQGRQLCDYVTRCQSFLQAGGPDADVLVYFPVFDAWSNRRAGGNPSPPGTVRMDTAGPSAAATLWRAGHDFDFTSDRLLESVKVSGGRLVAPGTSYRALVVSDCRLMPAESLERIVEFVSDGAAVILHGKLPTDVPGLGDLERRRVRFRAVLARIEEAKKSADASGIGKLGRGRIIFGEDVLAAMAAGGVPRESMTDSGLRYIRRKDKKGTTYFIANPADNKKIDGWVPLSAGGTSAVIFDPMTGLTGFAEFKKEGEAGCSVRLQIEPRESRIIRVLDKKVSGQEWSYMKPAGEPVRLSGKWEVSFLEGGETVPHAETINDLVSWTEWKSDQSATLRAFSGAACYKIKFQSPKVTADAWMIDLGEVRHTARVRLNGKVLGDVCSRPMRVAADSLAANGDNLLEIEVANAPINRAADLDIRGIPWLKTMGEDAHSFIIGDFLFPWKKKDAGWVPRPSGLLGPVQLVPMVHNKQGGV
ncbi:MAG: glycosyl hydrolase [bacterium]